MMRLDEALAVHVYLQHRAPGNMSSAEAYAMKIAMQTIDRCARESVAREDLSSAIPGSRASQLKDSVPTSEEMWPEASSQ